MDTECHFVRGIDDICTEPHTLECVRHVNRIARKNWSIYVSEESLQMKGNLMHFPDVGGKILGSQNSLPDALTT